jgi:hypothetical protein
MYFHKYFQVLHELQFAPVMSVHRSTQQHMRGFLDCCHHAEIFIFMTKMMDSACRCSFYVQEDVQSQRTGKTKCGNEPF